MGSLDRLLDRHQLGICRLPWQQQLAQCGCIVVQQVLGSIGSIVELGSSGCIEELVLGSIEELLVLGSIDELELGSSGCIEKELELGCGELRYRKLGSLGTNDDDGE